MTKNAVPAGGTGVPATSIRTENRRRPSRPATSGSVARCRRVPGTTSPRLVSYVGHPYLVFRLGVAAADRPVDRTPRLPIEQAMEVRS